MRLLRRGGITAWVDDDIIDWPGHRNEILDKMDELAELIASIETGEHSD